jgi:hypothetical protein
MNTNNHAPKDPSNTSNFKFKFRKKAMYTGPKGEQVPGKFMKDKHMARQYVCDKFIPRAQRIARDLLALRNDIIETTRAYKQWDAATYNVKIGQAGNVSITSFDAKMRVELRSHPDVIYSDQSIEVAKELMGQVIDDGTNGVTQVLKDLFLEAFTPKKKGLSLVSITTLTSYDIPDERWQRAVKALEEGREVINRSFYVDLAVKNDQNQWESIPLDISKA